MIYLRPLDLSVDEMLSEIVSSVHRVGATRVVIDSMSGFELALAPTFRVDFRESLYRLAGALTATGITIFLTAEVEDAFPSGRFTHERVSFVTDDILAQRYVEIGARLMKVLTVVKMRGSEHSAKFREYRLTGDGAVIGGALTGLSWHHVGRAESFGREHAPRRGQRMRFDRRHTARAAPAGVSPSAVAERLLLGALREHDAAIVTAASAERSSHLARLVNELSASLDESVILDVMRRVSLPRPGSWSAIELIAADGSRRRLQPLDSIGAPRALPDAGPDSPLAVAFAVPVGAGVDAAGEGRGEMLFVRPIGDAPFSTEEIALAIEITGHCAMALGHARLYGRALASRVTADEANRAKSAFLANMSHELRTPLNAIGGFVELIDMGLHGPVTAKQHDSLVRIRVNQQHLLILITGILDFAHIDGGHTDYRQTDVQMSLVIAEVAQMLSGMADAKGLTIERPTVLPDAIAWADPDRVRQILTNLVMNAVKYSLASAGAISIASRAAGAVVLTVVEDHGSGIPAERLESIFEPFVQLESGYADRRGGVGLGLTISRDLARAMGGSLTVESTAGHGSRFALSLPRARLA